MAQDLADRVRIAIEACGLTQNEVERRMDRSRGYLAKLLSREGQQPRRDSFVSFAKVTGVRVDWLLEGSMPMRATDASEEDAPELVAYLASPAAKELSEPTIAALRAFATKSTSRMTEEEIASMARAIEGQSRMLLRVVHDDPVEEARARAKKGAKKR